MGKITRTLDYDKLTKSFLSFSLRPSSSYAPLYNISFIFSKNKQFEADTCLKSPPNPHHILSSWVASLPTADTKLRPSNSKFLGLLSLYLRVYFCLLHHPLKGVLRNRAIVNGKALLVLTDLLFDTESDYCYIREKMLLSLYYSQLSKLKSFKYEKSALKAFKSHRYKMF